MDIVELHGVVGCTMVLGYIVDIVGWLCEECWTIWWGMCWVKWWIVVLNDEECWVKWWIVVLHDGECWVKWCRVFGYICGVGCYTVPSVGFHCRECWITWWRMLG